MTDSPFGLDPFSFVSTCIEDSRASAVSSHTTTIPHVPPASDASAPRQTSEFAVPAVPPHILVSKAQATVNDPSSLPLTTGKPKTAAGASKKMPAFTLPDSLFASFLRSINGSTQSKPVLIDELYKKYKAMPNADSLKKGAVEGKLAEVAFKEKKVWKIKPEAWVCVAAVLSASDEDI